MVVRAGPSGAICCFATARSSFEYQLASKLLFLHPLHSRLTNPSSPAACWVFFPVNTSMGRGAFHIINTLPYLGNHAKIDSRLVAANNGKNIQAAAKYWLTSRDDKYLDLGRQTPRKARASTQS